MTILDDEDENLAQYLESEVLSEVSDQEQAKAEEELEEVERLPKRLRLVEDHDEENPDVSTENCMEIGFFSKIPPELSHRILKFLSSETTMKRDCGYYL